MNTRHQHRCTVETVFDVALAYFALAFAGAAFGVPLLLAGLR